MRRGSVTGAIVLVVWLLIGVMAAGQRGYLSQDDTSCASLGTTLAAIVAGPLNYFGMNPKLDCEAPRPSE